MKNSLPPSLLMTTCAMALVACNPPLVKEIGPSFSSAGMGRVISLQAITAQTGEDSGTRVAVGLLSGGIIGALAATNTESDLGQAWLRSYEVRLNDGRVIALQSFSIVSKNECVAITAVADSKQAILEKLDDVRCAEFGERVFQSP